MRTVPLKVVRIGNSRGVRIPAGTLKRYLIESEVFMEERAEGIVLRPPGLSVEKLSWMDTAKAMASAAEDWSEWDSVMMDGLNQVPWTIEVTRRVAESKREYSARRKPEK